MWLFQRIDPYRYFRNIHVASFVGSGGKTSFAEYIAKAALQHGRTVAITTTTKIYAKEPYIPLETMDINNIPAMPFVRIGKTVVDSKLTGVTEEDVARIAGKYDLVLVEADGAKRMPLKYPAEFEPVIPSLSDMVFVVSGLDCLMSNVEEKVFRWEIFCKATGISGNAKIRPDMFLRFFSGDALMKGVDPERCVIVLNKYDSAGMKTGLSTISGRILEIVHPRGIIISSLTYGIFYGNVKTAIDFESGY